jgi:hypothetical protein
VGEFDLPTGQKDPFSEGLEVVQPKGNALKDFYFVVESFRDGIGFFVFPAVLDVTTPVFDGTGGRTDFPNF